MVRRKPPYLVFCEVFGVLLYVGARGDAVKYCLMHERSVTEVLW